MIRRKFQPGDSVVCRVTKHSSRPSRRAKRIAASRHGDGYNYCVDKYWVVVDIAEDNKLVVRTRRNKTRLVDGASHVLRRAHWWELLLLRNRFPRLSDTANASA